MDIIQLKSHKRDCPVCYKKIPYIKLPPRICLWSPSNYGWICEECDIIVLDGDIVDSSRSLATKISKKSQQKIISSINKIHKKLTEVNYGSG